MRHGEVFDIFSNQSSGRSAGPPPSIFSKLDDALIDPAWRQHCLRERDTFSPIVTYLAQLMAHDVTLSVGLDTSMHAAVAQGRGKPINLRQNPLALDTIYGEGMHLDPQLFVSQDLLGRKPSAKFALNDISLPIMEQPVRLPSFSLNFQNWGAHHDIPVAHLVPRLADPRNGDQPILMQITAEFMSYHNGWVDWLKTRLPDTFADAEVVFQAARALTILTYHEVLKSEIRNTVCCEEARRGRSSEGQERDLFQGVFRAFHSLALDRYHLRHRHKAETLKDMLAWDVSKPSLRPIKENENLTDTIRVSLKEWCNRWAIDWSVFLDQTLNATAFTPSFSRGFGRQSIFTKDVAAAELHTLSGLWDYPELDDGVNAFLNDINGFVEGGVGHLSPQQVPLHLAFILEPYHRPGWGRLGPTVSAAVLSFFERYTGPVADRALGILHQFGLIGLVGNLPKTFKDMIRNF